MNLDLKLHDQPVTLIVSCTGDADTGGGFLYYDGQSWIGIDDVSTTGLFVSDDELIRILWAPSQYATGTSILHYTSEGFARKVTVDGLTDPHDVLWDGQHYLAVSSFENSVVWFTAEGTVVKRFQPAPAADCWHLNSLFMHEGVLYATAFGRFEEPRGWVGHQNEGTGMLFRLDTGTDVLIGLSCPHSPRLECGQWVVCNSASSDLRVFSATGELIRCVQLQDWSRGLVFTDRYVLVGESVNRLLTSDVRGATIAVLDRKTWKVLGRLQLPYREVYDLVLAAPKLLGGIVRSPNVRLIVSCPPQFPIERSQSAGAV